MIIEPLLWTLNHSMLDVARLQ